MIARIALLLGLFGVPAVLLMIAHGIRNLGETAKRRFWGGVIGHVAGITFALLSMMMPPVLWSEAFRTAAVHWSMIVGFGIGVLVGPLVLKRTGVG